MKSYSVKTGPFLSCLSTSLPSVITSLELLYPGMISNYQDDFYDFHIKLSTPQTIRRWLKPQVVFFFDGKKPFKPLPLDQAFPMFEWGLNWCISQHCHHYLIIHAAVVAKNDKALILPGQPGAGKSTLCAALIHSGWRLLSDELTLLSLSTGLISPLARPICLKNESIKVIQDFAPEAVFGNVVHDTVKGSVTHVKAPDESIEKVDIPATPLWVVFPQYQTDSECLLSDKKKGLSFMELAKLSFNYNLLALTGFNALSQLVENSGCYDLRYSRLEEAILSLDNLVS
ncbi:HprK-related kinase A [Methylicorpusculum oleiharenae]|uniref:HprK-related kinase A n=1 Tax=Methylicorpusculum oleiharenae TaxID=1338687 RepID=UPI001357B75A|nr:HprK-related kinase A [Methylicorpusculum oleiharenae]